MNIAEAAQATRSYRWTYQNLRYWVCDGSGKIADGPFGDCVEAQAACDRRNLLAVLESIRKPSEGMIDAIGVGRVVTDANRWRTMIDALIAEVMGAGDDA